MKNNFNFKFDYNQSEFDGDVLKNILLSKMNSFTSFEDMERYVRNSYDGFWSDVNLIAAKQLGKKYLSQVENYQWYFEYFDFLADRDFAKAINKGLKTRNRKYADKKAFFEKYKTA